MYFNWLLGVLRAEFLCVITLELDYVGYVWYLVVVTRMIEGSVFSLCFCGVGICFVFELGFDGPQMQSRIYHVIDYRVVASLIAYCLLRGDSCLTLSSK